MLYRTAAALLSLLTAGDAIAGEASTFPLSRPGSAELSATIEARDKALFAAVFERCDIAAVRSLVTDDMEFFHDQSGLNAESGDAFTDAIRKLCARQASGEDYRSRRELVPGSLFVQPLGNYGAVETGLHRFYRLDPGKPPRLTGEARFTHVWKNDNGTWRLARVVSYAHSQAP
ncbi:uncharacterized protein DUF4440 [Tahibacter aquaticus]|uniref:Uncharacterized protein DUF4440 n=1 Tax=Tahibacter aquaticus TaxID=520092 RepID=A0A4R6Z4E1_9GAMM|nr:nuclear transport factor 2 family protein [Tahibacter aquaticus]TDR46501.1 uncharacterized protein DUF4440 [Tahibacter aquaticus]